jgi:predicted RNA binding protein YcfA (HicA-like mRNA interferase family)
MTRKQKLLYRLLSRPRNFSWDEAVAVASACGFELFRNDGSARAFRHRLSGVKLYLHEPHPEKILLRYAVDRLIEALRNAGDIP